MPAARSGGGRQVDDCEGVDVSTKPRETVTVTFEEVSKLARLARLKVDDTELEALRAQLVRVVGFVEQLREVDVEGVAPMTHALPLELPRRADEATDDVAGRKALMGSAGYEDGLVRLPRVVE